MKILFINPTNKYSGGEVILYRLVNALKNDPSFDISFYCQRGEFSDLLQKEGYKVKTFSGIAEDDILKKQNLIRVFKSTITIFKIWKNLYTHLKNNRPNLVQANLYLSAIFAVLPAYLLKIPVIWHDHTIHSKRAINRFLLPIVSWFVSKVVVVSDAVKQSFIDCGASVSNILRIYNGVDTKVLFNQANYSRGELRSELGISKDRLLFCFIGVICHLKGVHNILTALKLVKKRIGPSFRAVTLLVGSMREFDSSYHAHLKSEIEDGLKDEVIFLGPRKDIPKILKDTDCLLFTSVDRDALPTVLLEAMSMGKIIIASRIGGAVEILPPESKSFFYSPTCVEELAERMLQVYKDYSDIELQITRSNRQRAENLFSIETQVLNFKKLYMEYVD